MEPEPGPAAPEVAGGEDDPAEKAAQEDQPGTLRARHQAPTPDRGTKRPADEQDRLF